MKIFPQKQSPKVSVVHVIPLAPFSLFDPFDPLRLNLCNECKYFWQNIIQVLHNQRAHVKEFHIFKGNKFNSQDEQII